MFCKVLFNGVNSEANKCVVYLQIPVITYVTVVEFDGTNLLTPIS